MREILTGRRQRENIQPPDVISTDWKVCFPDLSDEEIQGLREVFDLNLLVTKDGKIVYLTPDYYDRDRVPMWGVAPEAPFREIR